MPGHQEISDNEEADHISKESTKAGLSHTLECLGHHGTLKYQILPLYLL